MRSSADGTIPSSRNAFSPAFLKRISERDEPPTAGEADVAGPWHLEEIPDGWALLPLEASLARGDRAYAIFGHRWAALLAAAFLPGTVREPAFRLDKEVGHLGYALKAGREVVGFLSLFDEKLVDALNAGESLLRSPESLANFLESGGQVALERSGAILEERVAG